MRINNTSSLLNLKGVFVKNIINHDNLIEIFVETKKKKGSMSIVGVGILWNTFPFLMLVVFLYCT